jgi:hypothetical protein
VGRQKTSTVFVLITLRWILDAALVAMVVIVVLRSTLNYAKIIAAGPAGGRRRVQCLFSS